MALSTAKEEIIELFDEVNAEFGETIVIYGLDFNCEVVALVELDETGLAENEVPLLEGRVSISVKDRAELRLDSSPALEVKIREKLFHLMGPVNEEGGLLTLRIRQKISSARYSNNTDLNDGQARF